MRTGRHDLILDSFLWTGTAFRAVRRDKTRHDVTPSIAASYDNQVTLVSSGR
jgi:hypothetical protein